MRPLFLAVCLIGITPCIAQPGPLDSMLTQLKIAKEDTAKVHLCTDIAYAYFFIRPDSSYYFAKLAEDLSGQLDFPPGLAIAVSLECSVMTFQGNYPEALRLGLKSLRIADDAQDPDAETDALNALGTLYFLLHEYRQALTYYLKSIPTSVDSRYVGRHERALTNTGDLYQAMGMTDSALVYSSQAYEIFKGHHSSDDASDELNNLAAVYSSLGRDSLAHRYFTFGLQASRGAEVFDNYCVGALGNARLFLKEGKKDSALFYDYLASRMAHLHDLPARELDADKTISDLYEQAGKTDSSFVYLKITVALQDSLFSQERLKAIQNMTLEENTRQLDLAAQKKKEDQIKLKNLELIAIAIFIPIFFLVVLLLYRIKVKPRIIEFLAIMNLILVVEFLTDLTFPLISNWTNDSPLWEMLILVLIAAILEPLNFKVESWLKRKLTPFSAFPNRPS